MAAVKNSDGVIETMEIGELKKQNTCLLKSALKLLDEIFDLNGRHEIAMKTIIEHQKEFEKIKETDENQKAISKFEKLFQLTMLQKQLQQKQTEAAQLQEEISNYYSNGTMIIGHDSLLNSRMTFFIILCELTVNMERSL